MQHIEHTGISSACGRGRWSLVGDRFLHHDDDSLGSGRYERENKPEISLMEFKTERRKQDSNDDDDWMPWYSLEYGIEESDSASVVTERDPFDKKLDYTFRVTLVSAADTNSRSFSGTWEQNGKEYEWKGTLRKLTTRSRTACAAPERGPGGQTLQQLLSTSSLSSVTKVQSENVVVREDIAQNEGDRIFARIILHSAPDDVKELLCPDLPALDPDETKIKELGPEYLERAGIVNIIAYIKNMKEVSPRQRRRIDETKCQAFTKACAAFGEPNAGVVDHMKVSPDDLSKFQVQYRAIAQACYRLGYIRAVLSFQPFLAEARYWYTRLATYLVSERHLMELKQRVRCSDTRIQQDIFDWQNKLQILEERAGDIGNAPQIPDVVAELHGVATFAILDGVMWSDEHASSMVKFFEDLDEIERATKLDKFNKQLMDEKAREYAKLQELLAEREAYTWSEVGKSLVEGFGQLTERLHRKPSMEELTTIVSRAWTKGGVCPEIWRRGNTLLFKKVACAALVMVGTWILMKALRKDQEALERSEQISMFASLVGAVMYLWNPVVVPIVAAVAKGLGWGLKKLLPTRALGWVDAAKVLSMKFSRKFVNGAAGAVCSRAWSSIASGLTLTFGFFVSVSALVASAFELKKMLKEGRTIDKWFAGAQLTVSALSTIAFSVQLIPSCVASTAIVALSGTVGMWLAGIGVVVGVVALAVTLSLPGEDRVKMIIDKYGARYGLLR
ncbi:uncharacterized protein PHACADRAFT_246009 [Phanerochaete carnosa HHB-10118-sp]|uniref:Uncharacterized protein n=1 Tax=Phanerochaete carnosa (strain HHB-10118-sp) TaxID=650164 RepID=K5WL65_PHACS|nr:uncharacterized protein PHACADRAFT_246009 [Phanerochaete carnosa HHB-10118-sp]EKM60170.1 hypothetical protein PHACADRAFT_246009 [Phanerochaete carnosa HHB-10118-sp]